MTATSPLLDRHQAAGAAMLPYGPPEAPVLVPASFEAVGAEYAAIRTGAALIDAPGRGTLQVTGPDRLSFLNSMVTQELKVGGASGGGGAGVGLADGRSVLSFWLNRKGRIDADLRLTNVPAPWLPQLNWFAIPTVFIDVDVHAAARAAQSLGGYLIAEDASIVDVTDRVHRLALHGPRAPALLAEVSSPLEGAPALAELVSGSAAAVRIADVAVLVERSDTTGEPGFEISMPTSVAPGVYDALRGAGATQVGWHAYNTARIEAGTPLYYLDFGPTNLPAETGVLNERVSFKKGCYLGQEIVARMNSLGAPKQTLVALRIAPGPTPGDERAQPTTGAEIRAAADAASPVIGAITSSTISPKLGSASIAFAMVKFAHAKPDTELFVSTPAGQLRALVRPRLSFLEA